MRAVWKGAPVLFVLLGLALLGMGALMHELSPRRQFISAAEASRRLDPPEPRLSPYQEAERKLAATRQIDALHRAPVPLSRAMAEAVRRGWREERGTR